MAVASREHALTAPSKLISRERVDIKTILRDRYLPAIWNR